MTITGDEATFGVSRHSDEPDQANQVVVIPVGGGAGAGWCTLRDPRHGPQSVEVDGHLASREIAAHLLAREDVPHLFEEVLRDEQLEAPLLCGLQKSGRSAAGRDPGRDEDVGVEDRAEGYRSALRSRLMACNSSFASSMASSSVSGSMPCSLCHRS